MTGFALDFSKYETPRVRMALALDEADATIVTMCEAAVEQVEKATSFENIIDFKLDSLIDHLVDTYGLEEERNRILDEAKSMLTSQLGFVVGGKCKVQYIRQKPKEPATVRFKYHKPMNELVSETVVEL